MKSVTQLPLGATENKVEVLTPFIIQFTGNKVPTSTKSHLIIVTNKTVFGKTHALIIRIQNWMKNLVYNPS